MSTQIIEDDFEFGTNPTIQLTYMLLRMAIRDGVNVVSLSRRYEPSTYRITMDGKEVPTVHALMATQFLILRKIGRAAGGESTKCLWL